MRTLPTAIAACTLVAGIAGAGVAYQSVMASAPTPTPTSDTTPVAQTDEGPPPAQVKVRGTRFEWAPCPAPSVREGDACVTEVVHVVTTPAPVTTAGSSAAGVGAPAAGGGSGSAGTAGTGPADEHQGDDADEADDDEVDEPGDDGHEDAEDEDDHHEDHEDDDGH